MQRFLIAIPVVLAATFFLSAAHAQDVTAATEAPPAPAGLAKVEAAPTAAAADDEEEAETIQTLVPAGKIRHGGYGGPMIRYGKVAGRDGVFVGGKGGWIINHVLVLGGAGVGLSNSPAAPKNINDPTGNGLDLQMGYGGFMMEYFIMPKKVIHGTVSGLVGAGSIGVSDREHMDGDSGRCSFSNGRRTCDASVDRFSLSDSFFVFEPEVGVEANITSFFRLNLGVTYRVITGVNGFGLENSDARGATGSLTLKFGKF